ncbi:hypothetical protein ACIA8C_39145 [Nocardia sp. NPDC051321]|uniref:hypothetical protein n=1 Tax=Nocardia sp. NPDC051321 TaxID=3364323 RepID=UPI00379DF8E5
MSYDLQIWEGERPSSDAELRRVLDRISEDMERRVVAGEPPDPPSPAIVDFVQSLLRRWPDCGQEGSPWSAGGTGDADGSSLTVLIQWGREAEVSEFVAGLAQVHGLVCYDCQSGRLRP